jgi:REP element-mobilizing transposase RayT
MQKIEKYNRHSIRLKEYDYSQVGGYFVTICTQNKLTLLESVPVQTMLKIWWDKLPAKFTGVEIDQFIAMPNHIHGILFITGTDDCRGRPVCLPKNKGEHMGSPLQKPSLSSIVQWFKTMTTNEYISGVKLGKWQPFEKRFWQRNYFEHIIRDESKLNRIREYILDNPLKWQFDRENPDGITDKQNEKEWEWLEGKL